MLCLCLKIYNHILLSIQYTGVVMVIVISSGAIERGLNLRSGHTKDYEIGINCFFDK